MDNLTINCIIPEDELTHPDNPDDKDIEEVEPPAEVSRKRKRGNAELAFQLKKIQLLKDIIEVSYLKITFIFNNINILCLILITLEPKSNEAIIRE